MATTEQCEAAQGLVGKEVHTSEWLEVAQHRIDAFADSTDDHQWIHTDPARAAKESPYKTTIAHGFLTLSLFPLLSGLEDGSLMAALAPGTERVINYGLDKLRYPNAVRAGSRVRAHCVLLKAVAVPSGLQLHIQYTVEVESEAKPACVAEVLLRAYTDSK
eukprot:TRINITY_DN4040_c0_g1_i2.p1 TRINITY_DN4040_c0_g1~~TRINITY_DN4040_c0_g1_i2.p1  ORF type:complete len:161 (+),score=49.31 TRINITY_DN4040_c0_g1_i2:233-715(+)